LTATPLDRFAVLSDIHGNLSALEAVLADIASRSVSQIVNLGDHLQGPLDPVGHHRRSRQHARRATRRSQPKAGLGRMVAHRTCLICYPIRAKHLQFRNLAVS
jgi:hypothetical protein